MYEILPNLFLSGYQEVITRPDTFLVNCTKDLAMLQEDGIRVAVNDDRSVDCLNKMFCVLPGVVQVIDDALAAGKQVVVHCRAGQQRSAAVVAAYLVSKHGLSLNDAIASIKKVKRDAFLWMVNFQEPLEKFAATVLKKK